MDERVFIENLQEKFTPKRTKATYAYQTLHFPHTDNPGTIKLIYPGK